MFHNRRCPVCLQQAEQLISMSSFVTTEDTSIKIKDILMISCNMKENSKNRSKSICEVCVRQAKASFSFIKRATANLQQDKEYEESDDSESVASLNLEIEQDLCDNSNLEQCIEATTGENLEKMISKIPSNHKHRCIFCNKTFFKRHLIRHLLIHKKCTYCGYIPENKINLKIHLSAEHRPI